MLETKNLGGKCADLNALFVGLARAVGIPARDIYGVRVAKSEYGYRSLGVGTDNVTRAQHCRAEFYAAGHGWVPVDPADVRKVMLEEKPRRAVCRIDDDKVKEGADLPVRLVGDELAGFQLSRTMYALPGSRDGKIGFLMYPQAETAAGPARQPRSR